MFTGALTEAGERATLQSDAPAGERAARQSDAPAGDRVALRSAALAGDDVAPGRVLLAPWGTVESTNGCFVVDDEAARMVVDAFAAHGTDLPIDYEHQTLGGRYASPDGRAPAAGWIRRIVVQPGEGLYGDIEWTDEARRQLVARSYRYLSPVALIRREDRKLIALHSAALTNKPAIVGMKPIVNRSADAATDDGATLAPDDRAAEPTAQGPSIPVHSSPSSSIGAAGAVHPLVALREELNLNPDACVEEVLTAAGRRLRELDDQERRRRAGERVNEALRCGRLVEAQRAWAMELVLRDEASFDAFLKSAPVLVSFGRTAPPVPGHAHEHRAASIAARARAEYRGNPLIARLTSEEAYVEDAVRSTKN